MTRPLDLDLEAIDGDVDNQGALSDCTGEAIHSDIDIMALRAGVPFRASTLFAYWTAGQASGWGSADDGRKFSSLLLAADPDHYGVCPYDLWPTDPAMVTTRPSDAAFAAAAAMRVRRHESCGVGTDLSLQQIDAALLAGAPVCISLIVTEKFFTLGPGDTYLGTADPTATQRYGHEVCIVGYYANGDKKIKNQYGPYWWNAGYGRLTGDVVKRDGYDTRMIRELDGIPLVPVYVEPVTYCAQTYLDDADTSYELTNSRESVHGSNIRNQVVLRQGVNHVLLDGNIRAVVTDRAPATVDALQTGNVLNLYWNGGLLVQWPICSGDDVLIAGGVSFGVTLGMDGVMRLNGNPVSSISPTAIT